MTTRTWSGTTGNFTDAASWSPTGVPQPGDTAIINNGTVQATGATLATLAINLTQQGTTTSTTLGLANSTLAADTTLTVNNPNSFNATAPTLSIAGVVTNNGTANFTGNSAGTQILIPIAAGGTLINHGTMNFITTSPQFSGGGTLENDATLAIVRPNTVAQIPIVSTAVTGSGVIELGPNAKLDLAASVAAGQTIRFNGGAGQNETLQLDQANQVGATIAGFSSGDLLAVTNLPYTTATYTSTSATSGVLSLLSGSTVEANLNFSGSYSRGSFTLTYNDFGGGLSNLQITTSAVNAQSGNLPPGYGVGTTGGGVIGAVYRFFDKNTGTHFFTSDAGERNSTRALANYVQETNDFGDVAPTDPNSEPVFRFFDTHYGTHFFTASSSERDTVLATRPDLTYEPNSTFYEHSTQQAGDVAVYRFFDTQFGTHFYTGDAGEAATTANLLIAGTSNHQFTAEGVGFYAPAGSFV